MYKPTCQILKLGNEALQNVQSWNSSFQTDFFELGESVSSGESKCAPVFIHKTIADFQRQSFSYLGLTVIRKFIIM